MAGNVKDRYITLIAFCYRPDTVIPAEGGSGVGGGGHQALGGRHLHLRASDGEGEGQRLDHRRAGVAVRGDGDGEVGLDELASRGLGDAEEEGTGGQEHGHGSGLIQSGDAGVVDVFEVVGGEGADFRGQSGGPHLRDLIGMEAGEEAEALGGGEHAAGLRHAEGGFLAEHVAEFGQPFIADACQRCVTEDRIEVGVGAIGEFAGRGVRGQIGADKLDGLQSGQSLDGLQHLDFVLDSKAVAAFDFDGGNAVSEHAFQAGKGEVDQFIASGLSHGVDRDADAAARLSDLFVGSALDALNEFGFASSGEDGVGVAVDEAGDDAPAVGVDGFGVGGRVQVSLRSEPGDAIVFEDHRGGWDAGDMVHLPSGDRPGGDDDEFGDVFDDEHGQIKIPEHAGL